MAQGLSYVPQLSAGRACCPDAGACNGVEGAPWRQYASGYQPSRADRRSPPTSKMYGIGPLLSGNGRS